MEEWKTKQIMRRVDGGGKRREATSPKEVVKEEERAKHATHATHTKRDECNHTNTQTA